MRISRFYTDQLLNSGDTIVLGGEIGHYVLRVLRLRRGDPLVLFNGDGSEYQAVVSKVDRMQAAVLIGQADKPQRESTLRVSLGQGIPRGERMDFVLQKSVELGAVSISPLWTKRCQVQLSGKRLANRLAHWQGILQSACEQSNRVVLPGLDKPTHLPEWLAAVQLQEQQHKLVLDPSATRRLRDLRPASSVSILVGPEGGLDEDEIRLSESNGFQRIRLGPRVLRTETAPLAVLAAIQALWGDL
jgi:16S rRNA (uracil1498-N3)-methyltransferase